MSDDKIHLGVIFGGRSGEHEVSLMSARSVLNVLDPQKYTIVQIGITHDGSWVTGPDALTALENGQTQHLTPVVLLPEPGHNCLYARRQTASGIILERIADLDVLLPVLHGSFGEDGAPQGLFEMAEIAYVGAGVLASAVAMDKVLCKDVLRAHDLPVTSYLLFTRQQVTDTLEKTIQESEDFAAYPLFTKPVNLGSSVGINKCHNRAELADGLREAALYDRRIMVEQGIPNPMEIEVSVIGNDRPLASQPGEVRPSDEFYSYAAKYLDGTSDLLIPAPLPLQVIKQIRRLATQAYRAVDCAGMARVDFLIEPEEFTIYINELNTIPGFTKISMYPKLWEVSGLPYSHLIDRLIELALERKAEHNRTERRFRRDQ